MNVTVVDLAPCRKLLRVEVDADAVNATFEKVTSELQREVRVPGFRPGKAPKDRVAKTFADRIEAEVKRRLISEKFSEAMKQHGLQAAVYPAVEEIQFGRGQPLQFAVTVETNPRFSLPEYKGIPVRVQQSEVTDTDLEKALAVLQAQKGDYRDVDRPAQLEDLAVINYTGTAEGKPLRELELEARSLAEQKDFWVQVRKDSFIPGLAEQLVGMKSGDRRQITVSFPADFLDQKLAGKEALYDVELVRVKERVLPELNDEFAKLYGAANLEQLRAGVRSDLQEELSHKRKREITNQLVRALISQVQCDLPESLVNEATKSVVYDIVRDNQQRGIPNEVIDQQKDEIYTVAHNSARDRVKFGYILDLIAEKEGISVTKDELTRRIVFLAHQNKMSPKQFVSQIQEKNALGQIQEEILHAKVIDFLIQNAHIHEAPAGSGRAEV